MKGFRKHSDRLERELRAQRPEPRAGFLNALETRIVGESRTSRAGRVRIGLAIALAVGMVSALGAFGGLSYAATGVTHAVQAAAHAVTPSHNTTADLKAQPLSSAKAQYLVAMCFFRHTIYVDSRAARILRLLGAKDGPCKGGRRTPPTRTTVVCVRGHNIRVTTANGKALINARKAKRGFCKT
jgi:ribosomal protein L34